MKSRCLRFLVLFFLWGLFAFPPFGKSAFINFQQLCLGDTIGETILSPENFKSQEKKISEFWMGIYMNGIKIGYSFHQEFFLMRNGRQYIREYDESWMRVTRLGGNPVELATTQESISDAQGKPLECVLRTKMSESETVIKAEVSQDKIVFLSEDKVIKEIPYEEPFHFGIPLKKIIDARRLHRHREHPPLGFHRSPGPRGRRRRGAGRRGGKRAGPPPGGGGKEPAGPLHIREVLSPLRRGEGMT